MNNNDPEPFDTPENGTQSNAARKESIQHGENLNRQLAKSHYENFSVGSILLPKRLRQELFNIYAFARTADDIADCPAEGKDQIDLLNQEEAKLLRSADGLADEPLYIALGETIARRNLSIQPFQDLLKAFRQDVTKHRYASWDELRAYTKWSADPVGRLVLAVSGQNDSALYAFSDNICTALQLANHWQDIREDYERGRIYIPQDDMTRFGVTEQDIADHRFTPNFRELMIFEVKRARSLFEEGKPLINRLEGGLSAQIMLYWLGGNAALDAIESIGYDVLNRSAKIKTVSKYRILARVLCKRVTGL